MVVSFVLSFSPPALSPADEGNRSAGDAGCPLHQRGSRCVSDPGCTSVCLEEYILVLPQGGPSSPLCVLTGQGLSLGRSGVSGKGTALR